MNAGRDAALPGRGLLTLAILILAIAGCDDDPADPDPGCGVAETLPFDQTLVANLGSDDPFLDGSRIDYYGVQVPATGTLTVEMAAGAIDPFLYLWAADQDDPLTQAFDPTGEGDVHRALLIHAVVPGCYRVGASGWPSTSTGEYTIRAEFTP